MTSSDVGFSILRKLKNANTLFLLASTSAQTEFDARMQDCDALPAEFSLRRESDGEIISFDLLESTIEGEDPIVGVGSLNLAVGAGCFLTIRLRDGEVLALSDARPTLDFRG